MTQPQKSLRAIAMIAALALLPFGAALAQERSEPKLDVPFVPTPQETVDRMLAMAKVGPNDYLIDLGSGDGRIPITAAKKFGTRGLGVDLNPVRVKESLENAKQEGVSDKVEFKEQNLFETDISKATVLTMYLLPDVNLQLRPKILEVLKPGTRVVSHQFTMGDWKPDAETVGPEGRNNVYLWIVPEPGAKK